MARVMGWIFSLVVILTGLGIGMGILANTKGQDSNPMVPAMLVLGGVAGLLLILIIAGIAYKGMEIADPTQAFALPEGSIRSVVATTALLLFGIVPLFLYATLSGGTNKLSNLGRQEALDFRKSLKENFVGSSPDLDTTPPTGSTPQYTIFYHTTPSAAATDLSKQFFTALATLVAAVSSFFFGSAVATSATKAGAQAAGATSNPVPSLQSIQPPKSTVPKPAAGMPPSPQLLTLNGSGLDLVTKVDLVQNKIVINAYDVTSNPSMVKFTVPISDTMSGIWSILITTSDNKKANLTDAFQIS